MDLFVVINDCNISTQTKIQREKPKCKVHKNTTCCSENFWKQLPAKHQLYGYFHLTKYSRKTNMTHLFISNVVCSVLYRSIPELTYELCGHWMQSRGPANNGRRLGWIGRELGNSLLLAQFDNDNDVIYISFSLSLSLSLNIYIYMYMCTSISIYLSILFLMSTPRRVFFNKKLIFYEYFFYWVIICYIYSGT